MKTHSYLNFAGNAEEAFVFCRSVFGGEFFSVVRFKDFAPIAEQPWGDYFGSLKDKFGVMWMVDTMTSTQRAEVR